MMRDTDRPKLDQALELLLDANDEIYILRGRFWARIKVWLVEPRPEIPHGIRYSLSLHDRYGTRVLGLDNAHGLRSGRTGYGKDRAIRDHLHVGEGFQPYEFKSASQLLCDFWEMVNNHLESRDV